MDAVVKNLLRESGRTFAEEAGITLKDQPASLFKLLVLANLLSARITAGIAVAAARELFEAGGGTARGMAGLSWQDRVDALGRGHYVRYDESTASRLGDTADLVRDKYKGDLRRLAADAGHDPEKAGGLLQEFPGIGPTGVDIFLRGPGRLAVAPPAHRRAGAEGRRTARPARRRGRARRAGPGRGAGPVHRRPGARRPRQEARGPAQGGVTPGRPVSPCRARRPTPGSRSRPGRPPSCPSADGPAAAG